MKGNFTRLQTHSSISPKRYSPPGSGFPLVSSYRWKWAKNKNKKPNPQTKPGEILSISSVLLQLPPQAPPGLDGSGFLPRPAEAGRKLGAALSASSPAVCVRVHAHVSPAQGPGTGTALGTVSPTAQLWGLARLGGGGDASAAAESPAARTHPGRPALAPPPPSPPSSGRTGELGYQLPPPTPAPLPARAFCGNAPGRFHHPLPAATRPRVSAAGRTTAPRWGRHVTRLGEGVRRRGGQVVLGPPPLGLRSFPIWVPVALGRREGRGGRPGGRR